MTPENGPPPVLVAGDDDAQPMGSRQNRLLSSQNYSLNRQDWIPTISRGGSTVSGTVSEYADYGNRARTEAQETVSNDLPPGYANDPEEAHISPGQYHQDEDLRGVAFGDRSSMNPPLSYARNIEITAESSAASTQTLDTRIEKALCPDKSHRNSDKFFLPHGDLLSICTRNNVIQEITRLRERMPTSWWQNGESVVECADYVCESSDNNEHSSREIFAILSLIKRVDLILHFKKAGIRDSDLPLSRDENRQKLWCRGRTEKDALPFLSHDEDDMMTGRREFYSKQWWVHIPFIGHLKDSKPHHWEYEEGTIMPWTSMSDRPIKGGFGMVHKVQIHDDHHAFKPKIHFALKTLDQDNDHPQDVDRNFRAESKVLRSLRRDDHIVELCATYKVGDRCMLLFPWADGGSLGDLWDLEKEKQRVYPSDLFDKALRAYPGHEAGGLHGLDCKDLMQWIAHQCLGIAKALATMHKGSRDHSDELIPQAAQKRYCRHGDIKPHNILYFSQEQDFNPLGNLKLADFGLAEIHRKTSRTGKPNGPQSWAYRAPEYDLVKQALVSLPADVWALGCVFSEFLTWVVKGPEGVLSFANARFDEYVTFSTKWQEDNFFYCDEAAVNGRPPSSVPGGEEDEVLRYEGLKLKNSVNEWCKELAKDGRMGDGPTFLEEFLIFITSKMLHPWRSHRATAEVVKTFLQRCVSSNQDKTGSYWACKLADQGLA